MLTSSERVRSAERRPHPHRSRRQFNLANPPPDTEVDGGPHLACASGEEGIPKKANLRSTLSSNTKETIITRKEASLGRL